VDTKDTDVQVRTLHIAAAEGSCVVDGTAREHSSGEKISQT